MSVGVNTLRSTVFVHMQPTTAAVPPASPPTLPSVQQPSDEESIEALPRIAGLDSIILEILGKKEG